MADAQHLPQGRRQAGDRHLKFHESRDNLFAYVGGAMPILLLLSLYDRPWGDVITSEDVATEIVRTITSSFGLILAIPVTTAIAVLVAAGTSTANHRLDARQVGTDDGFA